MTMTGQTGSEEIEKRRWMCAYLLDRAHAPHVCSMVVYFTSHQARGSRQLVAGRGVHGSCSVFGFKSLSHRALPRVGGITDTHPPRGPRTSSGGGGAERAHSARPPAAQRRTSFLSHSALSAVSLATASAFSLAVSSARSASSRPTAAACVCAARTAHDWTKA